MAEEHPTYTEALAEIERLLATPRTPASSNPPGQLPERTFPAVGVKLLREQCGSPDGLLGAAVARLLVARDSQGPFGRPAIEDAIDLIALARWWYQAEAWAPRSVEIRKPTQVVTGRHVQFVRQPSKQPLKLWDLRWWMGERG